MTLEDDETYDLAAGPDEAADVDEEPRTDTATDRETDRVPGSPPTGVANAHLGTSGRPAGNILSPEELARTEVTGGAGLAPEELTHEKLATYFEEPDSTGR